MFSSFPLVPKQFLEGNMRNKSNCPFKIRARVRIFAPWGTAKRILDVEYRLRYRVSNLIGLYSYGLVFYLEYIGVYQIMI